MKNGEQSPAIGGNGGDPFDDIINGERVTQVIYRTGDWLDSVAFKTEAGMTYKIGGNGGSATHKQDIPAGANIIGLYGSHNNAYLLSLGLIISE